MYWSQAEKKAIWVVCEVQKQLHIQKETVKKKSWEEFVPWRRSQSMLPFHLHFHLHCILVNNIFKLLRSGGQKCWMKPLQPQYTVLFLVSLVWVSCLFIFFIEEENILPIYIFYLEQGVIAKVPGTHGNRSRAQLLESGIWVHILVLLLSRYVTLGKWLTCFSHSPWFVKLLRGGNEIMQKKCLVQCLMHCECTIHVEHY